MVGDAGVRRWTGQRGNGGGSGDPASARELLAMVERVDVL